MSAAALIMILISFSVGPFWGLELGKRPRPRGCFGDASGHGSEAVKKMAGFKKGSGQVQ